MISVQPILNFDKNGPRMDEKLNQWQTDCSRILIDSYSKVALSLFGPYKFIGCGQVYKFIGED